MASCRVCFSHLLRRSHSDGLAWIDGAGSNMRREDKRAEEGQGEDEREMEEKKG